MLDPRQETLLCVIKVWGMGFQLSGVPGFSETGKMECYFSHTGFLQGTRGEGLNVIGILI